MPSPRGRTARSGTPRRLTTGDLDQRRASWLVVHRARVSGRSERRNGRPFGRPTEESCDCFMHRSLRSVPLILSPILSLPIRPDVRAVTALPAPPGLFPVANVSRFINPLSFQARQSFPPPSQSHALSTSGFCSESCVCTRTPACTCKCAHLVVLLWQPLWFKIGGMQGAGACLPPAGALVSTMGSLMWSKGQRFCERAFRPRRTCKAHMKILSCLCARARALAYSMLVTWLKSDIGDVVATA